MRNISKVIESIKTHGVRKVLIEENKIEGLEWFLAKDVALNTQRAAFYSHLASDPLLYSLMAKLLELSRIDERLALWEQQLDTFIKGLSAKSKAFSTSSRRFNMKAAHQSYDKIQAAIKDFKSRGLDSVSLEGLEDSSKTLKSRINATKTNVAQGQKGLKKQIEQAKSLVKDTKAQRKTLKAFIKKYEAFVDRTALKKMEELKYRISSHYERSDQGLIHILEAIAERRAIPDASFDGSYQ